MREESIESYSVVKPTKTIAINIRQTKEDTLFDSEDQEYTEKVIDFDQPFIRVLILDEYYKAIMSGTPSWSPDKKEGQFGEEDLWKCIDAIRAKKSLSIGSEYKEEL